jgi:hypothetical protein
MLQDSLFGLVFIHGSLNFRIVWDRSWIENRNGFLLEVLAVQNVDLVSLPLSQFPWLLWIVREVEHLPLSFVRALVQAIITSIHRVFIPLVVVVFNGLLFRSKWISGELLVRHWLLSEFCFVLTGV